MGKLFESGYMPGGLTFRAVRTLEAKAVSVERVNGSGTKEVTKELCNITAHVALAECFPMRRKRSINAHLDRTIMEEGFDPTIL